jgi:hypothetical protein
MHKLAVSKSEWIEMYGGQAQLDRLGLEVIPCVDCGDSICHGWRVRAVTVTPNTSTPAPDSEIDAREAFSDIQSCCGRPFDQCDCDRHPLCDEDTH